MVGALTIGVDAGSIALATDDETLKEKQKSVSLLHWVKELSAAAAFGAGGALRLLCGYRSRPAMTARTSSPTGTDGEMLDENEAQRCCCLLYTSPSPRD